MLVNACMCHMLETSIRDILGGLCRAVGAGPAGPAGPAATGPIEVLQ